MSELDRVAMLRRIARIAREKNVIPVYSAKDAEHNNPVVITELIKKLMKEKVHA